MDFAIKSLLPQWAMGSNSTNVVDQDPSKMVEEFAKLLVAQITNQDPDKPMDPSEIITQNAQFTSSLATVRLANQMAHYQQVSTVLASVGKQVIYEDPNTGLFQTGKVSGANFAVSPPALTVNGNDIAMDKILNIDDPSQTAGDLNKLSLVSMLGKTVEYFDASNNVTTGVVDDVDLVSPQNLMTINGTSVPMTSLIRVIN